MQPRTAGPARVIDGVKIYVSAGLNSKVRASDLVGAITGEAGIEGGAIGGIQIEERYSLVEVRHDVADRVVEALGRTTLRGEKVTASRYNDKKDKKNKKAKKA